MYREGAGSARAGESSKLALDGLADAASRDKLKWAMSDPERLRPGESRQALTERAAATFAGLAQSLRERGDDPRAVAHFVNRPVLCMFAEDVDLLPDNIFTRMPEQARILVVDDDPHTLRFVRDALDKAGYAVRVTAEPGEIAGLIRAERPKLVLLDLMLPGADGIELMVEVAELSDLPVIFISGYGRDETIARAFEAGAADYIVKPFSPTELTARVGAALRARAGAAPFALDALAIDYERRRVTVGGRAVALTATEYEILRILSVDAGRVVTSESLLRQAWDGRDSTDTERVRAFVKQLRAKLGDDAARPTFIFNQRGVGYRMAKPGEE